MDLVYHEKQEGRLCGQHCVNNLLQGYYFTAVELAALARQMDLAERRHMAEAGVHTDDFRRFMQQPSENMDDTGMFSVQVLTSALRVWDLSLVPITSTSSSLAQMARSNPEEQQAFICNYKAHWFTVRKLGYQWFNLNSLLSHPELISPTYLSLFLSQLEHEGYAIFVVEGQLPHCDANDSLRLNPAQQTTPPRLTSQASSGSSTTQEEEEELREALALSLSSISSPPPPPPPPSSTSSSSSSATNQTCRQDSVEEDLQRAIELSLTCGGGGSAGAGAGAGAGGYKRSSEVRSQANTEDDDLDIAIKMSLEQEGGVTGCSSSSSSSSGGGGGGGLSLEEMRQRRLDYLTKKNP